MQQKNILKNLPFLIIIIYYVCSLLIIYPGLFSGDTNGQYEEYIVRQYYDWHPPLMNIWWEILHIKGAVFFIHFTVFCISCFLFCFTLICQRKIILTYIVIFFVVLNPLISVNIYNVWKDFGLLSFAFLVVALLYYSQYKKHYSKMIICILIFSIFYGSNVRQNGVLAFLPMVFFINYQLLKVSCIKINNFKVLVISFFVTLVMLTFSYFINNIIVYNLFGAIKTNPQVIAMRYDLAAIECMTHHSYKIPDVLFANDGSDKEREKLCKLFTITSSDPIFWHSDVNDTPFTGGIRNSDEMSILNYEWKNTVIQYFAMYTKFRTRVFLNSLKTNNWYLSIYSGKYPNVFDKIKNIFASVEQIFNHYTGAIFLLINIFFMSFKLLKRQFDISIIALFSGFCYQIGWLPVIPVPDSRYFLWCYLATFLGVIMHFANSKVDNSEN